MNRDANAFMTNLTQAARDNPLAAALIGGGALWLMFGNRGLGSVASGAASIAEPIADAGRRGLSSAGGAVADAGSRMADAVAGAGSRVADTIGSAASSMTRAAGDAAASGAAAIRNRAGEGFSQATGALNSAPDPRPYLEKGYAELENGYASARSALTDLLERQPLVLGAIGLAIGAGVASAVASTSIENEWAGSLSDDIKEAVTERAGQVAETAKRAAGEVGSDFRAAAGEAAGKLRQTGEAAVQAVKETADAGREF